MTPDEKTMLLGWLDALIANKPVQVPEDAGDLKEAADRIQTLQGMLSELNSFSLALAEGNIHAPTPPRENYLASGLKQLQSQMLHLAWQTEHIAQGDYRQHVDFMGDFSQSFNKMIEQLREREDGLRLHKQIMENVFNQIEPAIVASGTEPTEILYVNEAAMVRFDVKAGMRSPTKGTLGHILSLQPDRKSYQIFDEEMDKWYEITIQRLLWGDYQRAYVYFCHDITKHKVLEEITQWGVRTDDLEGLVDRDAFADILQMHWQNCMRLRRPLSALLFEPDGFEDYVKKYGEEQADRLLADFARILMRCIGRQDDVIARFGHYRFIALLPFTVMENAMYVAKNVTNMTGRHSIRLENEEGTDDVLTLTVSIGMSSVIPKEGFEPTPLVRATERALIAAQESGGNTTRIKPVLLPKLPEE